MPVCATCSRRSASPPVIRTMCGSLRHPAWPVPSHCRGGRSACPQAIVTDLGREQQRGVLAHELAHLVRRDPLWLGSGAGDGAPLLPPAAQLARAPRTAGDGRVRLRRLGRAPGGFRPAAGPLPPHRGGVDRRSHRTAAGAGDGVARFAPHASRRAVGARRWYPCRSRPAHGPRPGCPHGCGNDGGRPRRDRRCAGDAPGSP